MDLLFDIDVKTSITGRGIFHDSNTLLVPILADNSKFSYPIQQMRTGEVVEAEANRKIGDGIGCFQSFEISFRYI